MLPSRRVVSLVALTKEDFYLLVFMLEDHNVSEYCSLLLVPTALVLEVVGSNTDQAEFSDKNLLI